MNGFLDSLLDGQITAATAPVWLFLALLFGLAGGAIGGLKVGGEALGKQLAMLMGAFYGPFAALPGIIVAMIILVFI